MHDREHDGFVPEIVRRLGAEGVLPILLADAVLAAGGSLRRIENTQTASKAGRIIAPKTRFIASWESDVPVDRLCVGDQVRHPSLTYVRRIVSIKPHPRGGVQLKTVPVYLAGSRCENAAGKTIKAHLTGTAQRWDGKTMIEVPAGI